MSQSCSEQWYLYPVDQRCPEEIDRINPEDQPGPADSRPTEAVLFEPECQGAANQHPGESTD